ncbi:MAG: bifunctional oligoribonuclease/PAP phosphatase NrnA [Clostridiales bacterium]|nr:bifunctional oligoribonuclease/PAP phosphatase NrnA [Clostridiales bacterium]
MRITEQQAAEMLLSMDNILILAHEDPDGDAVGSACGLCRGLRSLGKTAYVSLEHMSKHMTFLTDGIVKDDYSPDYIVAVDTAERKMLGVAKTNIPKDCRVDLAIDHHYSNSMFAENTCLDENAAAAAEVVTYILRIMNAAFTKETAQAIYVGVSTDTGCFRYSNTKAKTLRIAADMADLGADIGEINKLQFETKTREYAKLEKMALSSMELFLNGKLAVIAVTNDMYVQSGVDDSETKPLSSLTRQIEGVLVGVTLREKKKGTFNISVRTNEGVDASEIAGFFSGGGHKNAAGGKFQGSLKDAVDAIVLHTEEILGKTGRI